MPNWKTHAEVNSVYHSLLKDPCKCTHYMHVFGPSVMISIDGNKVWVQNTCGEVSGSGLFVDCVYYWLWL